MAIQLNYSIRFELLYYPSDAILRSTDFTICNIPWLQQKQGPKDKEGEKENQEEEVKDEEQNNDDDDDVSVSRLLWRHSAPVREMQAYNMRTIEIIE